MRAIVIRAAAPPPAVAARGPVRAEARTVIGPEGHRSRVRPLLGRAV